MADPARSRTDAADLAVTVATLEDLQRRVREMSDRYAAAKRADVEAVLLALERSLRAAARDAERARTTLR
jgi:hypothetical protein